MVRVEKVEKRIRRLEGFDVHLLHLSGRDVRSNRMGLPPYPYQHPESDDMTVETWKDMRFRQAYPGFDVEVLDGKGQVMHGNTKLRTVRSTYSLNDKLKESDMIHIAGHTTDFVQPLESLEIDRHKVHSVDAGQEVALKVAGLMRIQ